MKVKKAVVDYLIIIGYDEQKVWFKDLAIAVQLVHEDRLRLADIYDLVAKRTRQKLNTVHFHFHRAKLFTIQEIPSVDINHTSSPKTLISRLSEQLYIHK
jgi:hypothetical protein